MTRTRLAVAGAGILLWAGAVAAWAVFGTTGLLLVLAALAAGVLALTVELVARAGRLLRATTGLSRDLRAVGRSIAELAEREDPVAEVRETLTPAVENVYPRVEALLGLHSALRPQQPLPPLGGWAVSPDFMARAVAIVLTRQPATIVECGSGTSTVYLGLALRKVGSGRVVALEHKEQFAEATRAQLAEHGLTDVATVHHAPLRPVTIEGTEWLWYDLTALEGVGTCEMLLVDGPPRTVQDLARYPALPLLRTRLAPGSPIVLDDYRRKGERRTVRRWMAEDPGLRLQVHEHEKGTAELRVPGRA